jgi:hypothetical protein
MDSMSKEQAVGRKALCALLVFFQLGFVLAAAFPGVLLCHRADGRTVLETAIPFGCSCEECEHCLERLLNPDAGRATRTAFDPCHCRHERFASEPGSSSGLVPKRRAVVPPAFFNAAAELPGLPDLVPSAMIAAFEVRQFVLVPADLSPLRC